MVKIDKVEYLLTKFGKTKADLIKELSELNKYIEEKEHGDLKFFTLQRMFNCKQEDENRIQDVKCRAEHLGYELSEEEIKIIVYRFLNKFDCTIDEDTQIEYQIERFVREKMIKYR